MTLLEIKTSIFRRTQTNATSFPASDMVVDLNEAANRVHARIRKYLDNFRPTAWTTSDLSTGTAEPKFDAEFHELIPLYVSLNRAIERNLPTVTGFLNRMSELERMLDSFYGSRNYEVFTTTIAAPGVITKDTHGLVTNDRVSFVTSGALPTGISVDTFYYVIYVDYNTFKLSATRDGTAISTSGSQSGVHYYMSNRPKRINVLVENNQ